eukprot:SAG22_NODE_880_length_6703_cov_8.753786_2_plen_212_part_00
MPGPVDVSRNGCRATAASPPLQPPRGRRAPLWRPSLPLALKLALAMPWRCWAKIRRLPTLNPSGDVVLVEHLSKTLGCLNVGDVVVRDSPKPHPPPRPPPEPAAAAAALSGAPAVTIGHGGVGLTPRLLACCCCCRLPNAVCRLPPAYRWPARRPTRRRLSANASSACRATSSRRPATAGCSRLPPRSILPAARGARMASWWCRRAASGCR